MPDYRLANKAASSTNSDITSMTALTQITRATGGAFDIAIGGAAGDDFTVDTSKLVVEGDTGNVGIGTTAPGGMFEVFEAGSLRTRGSFLVDEANDMVYVGRLSDTGADSSGLTVRNRQNIGFFVVDTNLQKSYFENGNVGIGTTAPGGKLCVNGGVTVGSDTDAGDNNLRVEGTINVIGGQIAFPATAVPSADPNTLDDYEEGTFTVVLNNFTFGGDQTYTETGRYTKIGDTVFYAISIDATGTTTIASTANTSYISTLPFTSASDGKGVTAIGNGSTSEYLGIGLVAGANIWTSTWSATGAGNNLQIGGQFSI